MKYLKMLGLAAVAAMALMAIGASTASATKLCEEKAESGCKTHVASGSLLKFTSEGTTSLTGPFGELVASCKDSTVEGKTSTTGSATETVKGTITTLDWSECNHPVSTIALGSLEVHKIASSFNGTVTSSGSTVQIKETLFGTCNFLTNGTDIGTLTGKDAPTNTSGVATFDIKASIPSENCGFNGTWEGSYEQVKDANGVLTPFNVAES
jgi:hypothetical protein